MPYMDILHIIKINIAARCISATICILDTAE